MSLLLYNSFSALIMRYSRTIPGDKYLVSVAVLMTELGKMLVCTILVLFEKNDDGYGISIGLLGIGRIRV